MKGFTRDLGVRCKFCHVTAPGSDIPGFYAWSSDDIAAKKTARTMMRMESSSARRMSSSLASNRLRGLLVAGQIAMAFVLLSGASLMIDAFLHLAQVRPGFDPSRLPTFSLSLPSASYKTPAARKALWQRLEEKLVAIP